jgi:hypothetical protein
MKIYSANNLITLLIIIGLSIGLVLSPVFTSDTSAADKADWRAGQIMDDGIFYNSNDMSVDQVQAFLNSKVPVCDTWGTQRSELGGGTRAQYGASRGYPAPFICLKDYYENPSNRENNLSGRPIPAGALSAAQLIKNAAVNYGISVRALLVIIQKESPGPLLTDTWPFPNQYRNAMGYGCPDTAPCDPQYEGFNNQVSNAARQFKLYKNNPAAYRYKPNQNNVISFQANASSCGTSNVYVETFATAGLYNYTPYQPNPAALNNMYGTGDSCSAYGNRNFWRMFTDWFGPTVNSSLSYSLIKSSDSPAVYLQASNRKYYIPSGEAMVAWGINNLTVRQVSQSYIDGLVTGPWLGSLLKDDWNNYFVVEGGKLHYVRDSSYLSLWNLSPNDAVQSLGLTYALPSGTWLGRFVQDSTQPSGSFWLIDKGQKHLINDTSMLYQWRYTSDQLTTVSTGFLNSIPTASGNVTPYAKAGGSTYFIDTGRKLDFANTSVRHAYFGDSSVTTYDPVTLSFLPSERATQFAINESTGQWFMLEGGRKHYIPTGYLADIWGKKANEKLTSLSSSLFNTIPNGNDLSYVVQTASPSAYWVIDGSKRYISDSATATAWLGEGISPPLYSNESVSLLDQGTDATSIINVPGSQYTYSMVDGVKHYLTPPHTKEAWGGTVMQISAQLINSIKEGSFVNHIVQNQSGTAFLLMGGKKYPIDANFKDVWGVTDSTIKLSDLRLSSYPNSSTLKAFVKIGSKSYIMTGSGLKAPINRFSDAYQSSNLGESILPSDYFETSSEASYLVKSSDKNDQRVWLINQGKKTLTDFLQQVSFGYLSNGVPVSELSPASIALMPTSTTVISNLIQKQGSGIKLLNFGSSLGFPDGNTLLSFISDKGIYLVSDSIFDSIAINGNVSRVIVDDQGKYYLMENGQRKWISNGTAYKPYLSIPRVYLYGITMALIPEGPALLN